MFFSLSNSGQYNRAACSQRYSYNSRRGRRQRSSFTFLNAWRGEVLWGHGRMGGGWEREG